MRGAVVVALSLLSLLTGCAGSAPTTPSHPTPVPPKVVVISIDGLRPDALSDTIAPNIGGLTLRGASSRTAQTIMPSNTLPSHVSMLSGYNPSVHKIAWDDYLPQRGGIPVPTIFSAVRAAGLRSVMVAGKAKFNHFRDTGAVDTYILASRGDEDVANEAVVQAGTAFDFMFVHFPSVDLMGHGKGWMSASYLAQLAATDRAVGRLLAALPRQATVIVTADHGGHGMGHGTRDPVDMSIPWLVAGPTVVPGVLKGKINTADTAATVAHLLGVRLPADATGVAVLEAFQAGPSASLLAGP